MNIASQEPFIEASKHLLGEHGCYPLMAIEKLKEKAAWQLYAGANDVEPQTANQISKFLDEYNKALKYADDDEKEDIHIEDYIPSEYIDVFKQSNSYRGITINLKCHACGMLLFNGDIRREIGLISAISESTGKRTLCAAVEGGYLDEFGYVKEDFLIVDSVDLTHKFFASINEPVPSFEELREMVKNDPATWEIYEKGITCCVNQCEKEATTNRCKKYKPKTFTELSSFIAAIRPGFASLLNTFLNREDYSTGEPMIDEILSDTSHFMIFQESIMHVLSFLGLKMDETYGVIKSISKKKFKAHPEKLAELKERLINGWKQKIGNTDNFDKIWKIIEDAASYAFNAPHAYSMAGDSLYQAWFKAHHTKEFYEVAIKHYQEKNKKDKINALVDEAIKFYGYKLGDYQFENDNRTVSINEEEKIIYPNLSSLKGFGEDVCNTLYECGQKSYSSFIEVLTELLSHSINKTIIQNLIKIDYFKLYGYSNMLLKTFEYYDLIYGAKTISKDKAEKNNIPFDLLRKYGNETAKQFNKIDSEGLLNELIGTITYEPFTLKQILDNQKDILGMVTYVDPYIDKNLYYVTSLENKKTVVNISLYEIYTGKTREVKMWSSSYTRNSFEEKDILRVYRFEKKNKREPNGKIDETTGKKIYVPVPDKFDYWLTEYEVESDV